MSIPNFLFFSKNILRFLYISYFNFLTSDDNDIIYIFYII